MIEIYLGKHIFPVLKVCRKSPFLMDNLQRKCFSSSSKLIFSHLDGSLVFNLYIEAFNYSFYIQSYI